MEFNFLVWWKKYGDSITAISIIFFIIFSVIMIKQDRELKEEISLNCGFGEDDYYCYCEKGKATEIKNKMEGGEFHSLNISNWEGDVKNVSVDI